MNTVSLRFLVCCVALLLAACGGGGIEVSDTQVVSPAAKCELQPTGPGDRAFPVPETTVRDSDAGLFVTLGGDERFHVFTQGRGSFYASLSTQGSSSSVRGIANELSLATDQHYRLLYATVLGTVGGRPLVGAYQVPQESAYSLLLGTASGRPFEQSDIKGVVPDDDLRGLPQPTLTEVDQHRFRVVSTFFRPPFALPNGVKLDLQVFQVCVAGDCPQLACRVAGLTQGDEVVITGGKVGATYTVWLYNTVMLDTGQTAFSRPDVAQIRF